MLSNILKNNLIASILLMLLLLSATFLSVLTHKNLEIPKGSEGVIYTSIMQFAEWKIILPVLSVVFIALSGFIFNFSLAGNETLTKPGFFVAFLFILLNEECITSYGLHPSVPANLLIILALGRMLKSYRLDDAKILFFDGAFLLSLSVLIYFPSITLLPLVFIALLILRPFIWREWMLAFFGLILPHLLAASVMYLLQRLDHYYHRTFFVGFDFTSYRPQMGAQYFVLTVLVFLFLLVIFNRLSGGGASRKIRQQKNINLIIFWLLLGLCSVFYESPFSTSIPMLSIPPIAALLSEWLGNMRKSTLSDFALLLLLSAFTLSVMQLQGML